MKAEVGCSETERRDLLRKMKGSCQSLAVSIGRSFPVDTPEFEHSTGVTFVRIPQRRKPYPLFLGSASTLEYFFLILYMNCCLLSGSKLPEPHMEDQVHTWSSICSCDTTPVHTTEVLIPLDQKIRLVLGLSSVYLCQFVADVASDIAVSVIGLFSLRCSLTANMVRCSEGRHARIYGHSLST